MSQDVESTKITFTPEQFPVLAIIRSLRYGEINHIDVSRALDQALEFEGLKIEGLDDSSYDYFDYFDYFSHLDVWGEENKIKSFAELKATTS